MDSQGDVMIREHASTALGILKGSIANVASHNIIEQTHISHAHPVNAAHVLLSLLLVTKQLASVYVDMGQPDESATIAQL